MVDFEKAFYFPKNVDDSPYVTSSVDPETVTLHRCKNKEISSPLGLNLRVLAHADAQRSHLHQLVLLNVLYAVIETVSQRGVQNHCTEQRETISPAESQMEPIKGDYAYLSAPCLIAR